MFRSIFSLFCLGLLIAITACNPTVTLTPTQVPAVLRLGFSDSVRPLVDTIVPIYGDESPTASLEVREGYSSILLRQLEEGTLDAVFLPGEPSSDFQGWVSPVAWDGIALVVHPENPVAGLALSQAQAIFQGQIWLWDAVGGVSAEIEVVTRDEGATIGELFQQMVMQERRVTLTAIVMPDTDAVLDYVASHSWAVGYLAAATADDRVKVLAVDGVYPSPETLAGQSYPLHYPVFFFAAQEPAGAARQLPVWLVSRDGQTVIGRKYGRVRQ